MLKEIDKKIKLDICITTIATSISVLFIISSYIFKNYSSEILSILIIVLPTIYIVGNLIIRGIMEKEIKDLREEYDDIILQANEGIEEMKQEIEKLSHST